jgi:hypothetical protein
MGCGWGVGGVGFGLTWVVVGGAERITVPGYDGLGVQDGEGVMVPTSQLPIRLVQKPLLEVGGAPVFTICVVQMIAQNYWPHRGTQRLMIL